MQSNDKLYVITRKDLTFGQQASQLCHALRQFAHEHPEIDKCWFDNSNYICLLSVDSEDDLRIVDISEIDFDKLKGIFRRNRKNTVTESLVNAIESRLSQMVNLNRTRIDYMDKFQKMINEYNSGACDKDAFFENLMKFIKELNDENKRGLKEGLSDEELAIFDLLTKPDMELDNKELQKVKGLARDLLPRAYTKELYQQKCVVVYHHIFESYYGSGQSIYALAA